MLKPKILSKVTALMITLSMVCSTSGINTKIVEADELEKTPSQLYVEAMGKGWNLGNTFDGVDTDLSTADLGENSWGNPTVTKELIKEIKDKGYDSIRIPMTAYKRYSLVDGKYVMNDDWVERYKEVVQWAVDEGLYVMVNIHHDSWIWLSNWDGNKESVEYKTYVDLWEQLADEFKDFSEKVCFETINEPTFSDTGDITAQDKLDMINLAAYNVIRNSGGSNETRMIVIPTLNTNHSPENSNPAYELIQGLNDENVIATVHYYSEWVFSANLGRTGFDEPLYNGNDEYTARAAAADAFNTIYNTFTANGIGVVIGEWGLLGYDAGDECNQSGEELKYYDYMNYLADEDGISIIFWDNGSGIDRNDTEDYSWKKPLVGDVLEAGLNGERSSYATDLNTNFFNEETTTDIDIPLTLNGNEFEGIDGLTEGVDYIYNGETATITLSAEYINNRYEALADNEYGEIADLVMKFSLGADWHQYLVKYTTPVFEDSEGTTAGLNIPVEFNGTKLRRATAYNADGNRVGPNSSWWGYLQNYSSFAADYNNGTIEIYNNFFNDGSVTDGDITFKFEFYDGQVIDYTITKDGENVTGVGTEVIVPDDDNEEYDDDSNKIDEENPGSDDNDDSSEEVNDDKTSNYEEINDNSGTVSTDKTSEEVTVHQTSTKKNQTSKLPSTGTIYSTNVICGMAIIMILAGAVLSFKRRKLIK